MSNRQKEYLSDKKVEKILKKVQYLLLLGERSNGKSYVGKLIFIRRAIKFDEEFIYLRRYDLDTKDSLTNSYFADVPVSALTDGEYSLISVYRKKIYLANVDEETGKIVRGKCIGYCHSIGGAEHYKSLQFPKVQNILFEEMIPKNGQYLYNEPDQLQHYVSTILRDRKGKVLIIANLLSRICPYYSAWNLQGTAKQELGTVQDYVYQNDNGDDTHLSVYCCDSLNYNSGMFFGESKKNITEGAYETEPQPHLPKSIRDYNVLYDIVLQHDYIMFYMQLLQDKFESNNIVWYVTPKTTPIKKGSRVVSSEFNTDPMYSRFLVGLTAAEESIFHMIKQGKICFSDDLTGTEFYNVLQYFTTARKR